MALRRTVALSVGIVALEFGAAITSFVASTSCPASPPISTPGTSWAS